MSSTKISWRPDFRNTVPVGLQTVPNIATNLTTTDTMLQQIVVANKSGGAVTFLVRDRQGSPKTIVPTVSITANTVQTYEFGDGVMLLGGLEWTASAAGALDAEVVASYK